MPHRRIPLVTAGPYGRAASGALIKINTPQRANLFPELSKPSAKQTK